MNKEELFELIDSLKCDIEFEYKGIHGAICPFSRSDIEVTYGDNDKVYSNIESLMEDPFFDGECLIDIATKLDIY